MTKASSDDFQQLSQMCVAACDSLYGGKRCGFDARPLLAEELAAIRQEGSATNFLRAKNLCAWARKNGIFIGPGRGRCVIHLVPYLLGITQIDPLACGLLSERAAFPHLFSPLDIDFEIPSGQTSRFIRGLHESLNVAEFAQVIPLGTGETPICDPKAQNHTEIVISAFPLRGRIPIFESEGIPSTHLNSRQLRAQGFSLIKVVESKALSLEGLTQAFIRQREPDFRIEKIPIQDQTVLRLLGCDFSEDIAPDDIKGFKNILRRGRIRNFQDIVSLWTLYRPGLQHLIPGFVGRDTSRMTEASAVPGLLRFTRETGGIFLYQDQINAAICAATGLRVPQSEAMRRAICKNAPRIARERMLFLEEAARRGELNPAEAYAFFAELAQSAPLTFPRSFAVQNSLHIWRRAWLKAHYPVEFMAAKLTLCRDKPEAERLREQAASMAINILPPEINLSDVSFTPMGQPDWRPSAQGNMFAKSPGFIFEGLANIPRLGEAVARAIMSQRNLSGSFASRRDFLEKMSDKTSSKSAAKITCARLDLAGAFRNLPSD